jgi:glycosyltransferase involved in cell wall biosynthesis
VALRVLFLESGTELGGAQFALLTLLRSLGRSHVEPTFVTLGFGRGDIPEQVSGLGIPIVKFPYARFRHPVETARRVVALARLARRKQVDVVFCNGGHALLFGKPAALLAGRPCAWWVHGYFPEDPLNGHGIALAERILQADLILANSQYTARMLRRVFPEHGRIGILTPAVDTSRFFPLAENGAVLRERLGLGKHQLIVGHFGRLHPFKGQHIFLQAVRQLVQGKTSCHFVLVGGTPFGLAPEYEQMLRRFVSAHRLERAVSFLGARSDVNELMNACDVVVHSSVEPEPWGLVVAEAMAAGRPVVATAGGGPQEMICDRANGRLVPANDAHALAAAIEGVLADPQQRRSMGMAARARAMQKWQPAAAAQGAIAALEGLART